MFLIIAAITLGVLIHELGHYLSALMVGFRVKEFEIGIGHKLLTFNIKNTIFNFRLLPLAGKVVLQIGNDGFSRDITKSEAIRFGFVAFSGPLSNILFGLLFFEYKSHAGSYFYIFRYCEFNPHGKF